MFERELTVGGKHGVHARVAMQIADAVEGASNSTVRLVHNGREVDAKSIMALMNMGAGPGTTLKLYVEGEDSESLGKLLSEMISNPIEL